MRWALSLLIALAISAGSGPAWSADPATLEQRATAIDRASEEGDGDRVVVGHISRKLGIPVEALRRQRMQTQIGWGEILIANSLAMAARLTFDQVVAEHHGGKTWAEVAREHKVDVDRLIADVQRSQEIVEKRGEDRLAPDAIGASPGRQSPAPSIGGGTGHGGDHIRY